MLYGTHVRVSLTHFKKILTIGFFIILQNVKSQYKKIPLIKFFEKMTFQALERW